jgi:hypothetical protein
MGKNNEFENILEACLARVLAGESIEACLADHPGQAAELEPLLRTALSTREAAAVKPRPEFRERAALDFQAAIRQMPAKKVGNVYWRQRWMGILSAVVFVLLAGTGLVAASSSSLPDHPLYGVKLATETAWLALTPSDLGKADLYVKFTDRRVDEIIAMAERGKVPQMDRATERLDRQMIAMAGLTAPEGLAFSTMGAIETTSPPMLAAPTMTVPATTKAATTVPETTTTATTLPPAPLTNPPPATTAPPPPATTIVINAPDMETGIILATPPPQAEGIARYGSTDEMDEEAKLRERLARSAAANTSALLEELDRAPESVRLALERAIEIANTGYYQNISNLGY